MKTIVYCLFQNAGYDGQNLLDIFQNKDLAILAFETLASKKLKGHMTWLDKDGYFCSTKSPHKPIVFNDNLYYIKEQTLITTAYETYLQYNL